MDDVIVWLLEGDPAIRWQVKRDLLGENHEADRRAVGSTGWGAELLSRQDEAGTWGGGLYGPKWISTTYTMLLLRRMGLAPDHPTALAAALLLLDSGFTPQHTISYFATMPQGEVCVTAMILSLCAHFGIDDERVDLLAEHLVGRRMQDGAWNCEDHRGATHSSFHTTITTLEALDIYRRDAGSVDVDEAIATGHEFFLEHRLYKSHRTGEVVKPAYTRFSFPPRWFFDVLRGLDHFAAVEAARDPRLQDAIVLLEKKRSADGTWKLQNRHSGRTFFEMEEVGKPSRWNTLRARRVLEWWDAG